MFKSMFLMFSLIFVVFVMFPAEIRCISWMCYVLFCFSQYFLCFTWTSVCNVFT
jgi:hypothetical protein